MKLTVDARQLTDEIKQDKLLVQTLSKALWAELRSISFALEARVKNTMPVDTGRARASWGHWTPGHLREPNAKASPGDAHWQEDEWKLEIEQGSNVEYIDALNEGHSKQAPAGFLERAEEQAVRVLEKRVDELINRYL